jgi:hypothetical protein
VTRPERIGNDDVQVWFVEWKIVVPPIPEDDVGFLLRFAQDDLVVYARLHHTASVYVWFIFLSFFYGGVVAVEVFVR